MLEHLSHNNMLSIDLKLLEDSEFPSNDDLNKRMEEFNEKIGRAVEDGKSKYRKLCLGDITFSKAFEKLGDTRPHLW